MTSFAWSFFAGLGILRAERAKYMRERIDDGG